VLVHGDLHGDNQVWNRDELQLVVDFETVGAAEPEYDLRTFPGPGMGPGVELLTAVIRHYQLLTGRRLSAGRVMAWHLRAALGDALWRSEASIPLPDHRTPPSGSRTRPRESAHSASTPTQHPLRARADGGDDTDLAAAQHQAWLCSDRQK
jgi:hypothetical protein